MNELLFEIGCEELPARVVPDALAYLAARAQTLEADYGIGFSGDAKVFGSPRRLALSITGLAEATKRVKKELLGPSIKAAFDQEGKPTRAAEGFAKTTGIAADKLARKQTAKGEYLYAEVEEGGEPAAAVLTRFLQDVLAKLPFPKSMRWGDEEVKFSRPVQWLVAVLSTQASAQVLPLTLGSLVASNVSRGHRFMANGPFQAQRREEYLAKLRESFVLPDPEERKQRVREAARAAAKEAGGFIYFDREGGAEIAEDPLARATYFDSLLEEITYLCETPFGVFGTFDAKALELPREVVLAAMRNHQRYFAVCDAKGELMAAFVTIAATRVNDPALVRKGNERVLKARLSDATYFFMEDQKRSLQSRVDDLKAVTYHKKIGTSYEKMERVAALAQAIAKALGKETPLLARAARLAKADLTTLMVGEFPELQGIVGAHYAKDEDPQVITAIRDHYRPRSADDATASSDLAAILAIADKLDTVAGIIAIGQAPTGSSDPFALRRAALGILRTIFDRGYDLDLGKLLEGAYAPEILAKVRAFIADRFLHAMLPEKPGPRADIVRAVVAAGVERPLRARNRILALWSLPELSEIVALLKRAQNILKEPLPSGEIDLGCLGTQAEKDLHARSAAIHAAKAHLDGSEAAYKAYLAEVTAGAALQNALKAFFDGVKVMDDDAKIRTNRLRLLHSVVTLTSDIADFSKITA